MTSPTQMFRACMTSTTEPAPRLADRPSPQRSPRGRRSDLLGTDRLPDHLDQLYRAAWAVSGSRQDAEDLVQETFVNVLKRHPSAGPVSRDGAYVNFMGDARDERVRASYGDANYERLVALKRRYDPTNLFSLNQNITP